MIEIPSHIFRAVDIIVAATTLLPLYITQYRWAPIRSIIMKEKKGFKELSTIATFAGLLGTFRHISPITIIFLST